MPTDLAQLLASGLPRSVSAAAVQLDGRSAIRVELLEQLSREGRPDIDYVDMPTFLELPIEAQDVLIEIDILARLNGFWPEGARGFAGVTFRIRPCATAFECVYLRPTNGRRAGAPSPRDQRAIQYFAYPDWRFERLRAELPGVYETGADIDIDEWITLRIEVSGRHLRAFVDGQPCLSIDTLADPAVGRIGLFVDIGTVAFFSNLRIAPTAATPGP